MYKKIIQSLFLLFFILSFGTIGYTLIEKWRPFDAFYMTVITLATVGYSETHPLTTKGRIFTVVLILSGVSLLLYTVSSITSFFIGGELNQIFRRNKMLKAISQLKNHYIVCGAGKIGSYIISELTKTNMPFVVIERNKEVMNPEPDYLYIIGDATDENILKKAGIDKAAGIFATLATDEENLFLIITAKGLAPKIKIVTKAVMDTSIKKLYTAGATSVVQPNFIGGLRMASEMLRPAAVSFLDVMLKEGQGNLRVGEVEIKNGGKAISDIPFKKVGVILLALANNNGYKFNPSDDTIVQNGDKLILIGNTEQLESLKELI